MSEASESVQSEVGNFTPCQDGQASVSYMNEPLGGDLTDQRLN